MFLKRPCWIFTSCLASVELLGKSLRKLYLDTYFSTKGSLKLTLVNQIFTSEQNCPLLKFSSLLNWIHYLCLGNWGLYLKRGRLLETASLCGLCSLRVHCSAKKGTCYFYLSSRSLWSIFIVLLIVFQDKGKKNHDKKSSVY